MQKDIIHPINWSLREFERLLNVRYFDNTNQLGMVLADDNTCCTLILDSIVGNISTLGFAKELKNDRPNIKILLIASSGIAKNELVDIIQAKIVNGMLVSPFTAEQISDHIYKLCNFQKPEDTPWYMKTGLKV